jgi:hypothetical protein
MNRLLKRAMLVLIVMSSLHVQSMLWAQEDAPPAGCDASSLTGSYGFGMSGVENNSPVAYAGLLTFDGAGKISGMIRNGLPGQLSNVTGTYKVSADCTGLAAITSPKPAQVQWTFFIALTNKNSDLYLLVTDNVYKTWSLSGTAKKQ